MITLEMKLRNDSRIVRFLDRIAPETFEDKIATTLNNLILESYTKYSASEPEELFSEEYTAILIYQYQLLQNPLLRKIEFEYMANNGSKNLLLFFKDEINEFYRVRNQGLNIVSKWLLYNAFNLSNQLVSKKIKDTKILIDSYFKNRFLLLKYQREKEQKKSQQICNVYNSFHNKTIVYNQSVQFTNRMNIGTYRHLSREKELKTLKEKHWSEDFKKADISASWIIEFCLSTILKFNPADFSKRKKVILELYGLNYEQYRHGKKVIDKNDLMGSKLHSIELAILYVDKKIEEEYLSDIFNAALLEKLFKVYDTVRAEIDEEI